MVCVFGEAIAPGDPEDEERDEAIAGEVSEGLAMLARAAPRAAESSSSPR